MQAHNPTSVFIVDDSDAIRQRLISMLGTMGNVTIAGEARTASEAIAGIDATHPDVVLLDLKLGDSSGMDVLRAVNCKLPVASVVVLTNHSEPQYRQACLKAGARYFLDKSNQFDSVRNAISKCIGNGIPSGRQA